MKKRKRDPGIQGLIVIIIDWHTATCYRVSERERDTQGERERGRSKEGGEAVRDKQLERSREKER